MSRAVFLIVDETYRDFVYGDNRALSFLSLEPEDPHIIVVDSLSKRLSLCGARIGTIITAKTEVLRLAYNLAQAQLAGPTIEQYAAAFMLKTMNPQYVESARLEYLRRRNALSKVEGFSFQPPEGAFYTLISIPGICRDGLFSAVS
jgi:aspartate aminotransferase